MAVEKIICQAESFESGSRRLSSLEAAPHRLMWHLQRNGFRRTAMHAWRLASRFLVGSKHKAASTAGYPAADVSLGLRPGDLVEVKALEEVQETLDDGGKLRGLRFMPEMGQFCGKRLRVYKRMERMIVESTMEVRRLRNTVLLDEAICEGVGQRCDRSCHYFWREAWLRRVEGGEQ